MSTTFYIQAVFDVVCYWERQPPIYRIYVNNELFAEREWRQPSGSRLQQILQLNVPLGKYDMRLESVGANPGQFQISNCKIAHGPAVWKDNFRIWVRL